MAPLDTGSVTNVLRLADSFGRGPGPSPAAFRTLGGYLRAVREHKGLSIAQVSELTRIRGQYLRAIDDGFADVLPSRPYAIGYVRAYARALGLDGDMAAARFRAEHPDDAQALEAPVGAVDENDPTRRLIYAGCGVLIAAFALWNVAQRTLAKDAPAGASFPPAVAQSWPTMPPGPAVLGAPLPPPADQTTPAPYFTPGLPPPDANATPAAAAQESAPALPPSPRVFAPHGAIYGEAGRGGLVVQARKAGSLVVRGPAGQVYFARQLHAGEAYRAPIGLGLTADVSDPTAFDVYSGGQLQGVLSAPQTSLDKSLADPKLLDRSELASAAPQAGAAPAPPASAPNGPAIAGR